MSSGREHERTGKVAMALGGVATSALAATGLMAWERGAGLLAGAWAGFFLVTPDADVEGVTRAEGRWFEKATGLFGPLLSFVRYHIGLLALELGFWPGVLMGHRGLSHVPVVGALVILALMAASPLGIVGLAAAARAGRLGLLLRPWAGAFVAGFVAAHLAHILEDRLA